LAALIIFIMLLVLTIWTMRVRNMPLHMRKAALWACVFIIMQVISGALVTLSLSNENVYIFTALIHTVIIAALFSVLCYMGIEIWKSERSVISSDARSSMN